MIPQQYATALVVTPQVWNGPVLIDAKLSPPSTRFGVERHVVEPSPSCPASLWPQQYAALEGVKAHELSCPDARLPPAVAKVMPPATATGAY